MATIKMDLKNLRCPQPILKITAKSVSLSSGDIIEVEATCPTFENDIRNWCDKVGKTLVLLQQDEQGVYHCQIRV